MKKLVLAKWDNELDRHIDSDEVARLQNIDWSNHTTQVFFCNIQHRRPAMTADEHRADMVSVFANSRNGGAINAYLSEIDWEQVAELSQLSGAQKDIVIRGNLSRPNCASPIIAGAA